MDTELLKETIKKELPNLLRDDPALRAYSLELTQNVYAGRQETQDRFWEVLAELRCDREEQARKWEANQEELRRFHQEIMAQASRHDRSIGALGAR